MCGRYSISITAQEIAVIFGLPQPGFSSEPRYNVAPTQSAPIIVGGANPRLALARWGLVPPWSKDLSIGSKMINARAETLAEKMSFKDAFQRRRCLVPADGFFEWRKQGNSKQPFRITLANGRFFAMAGLWECFMPPTGPSLTTFTIITTEPSDAVRKLHSRMPVILATGQAQQDWLSVGACEAQKILVPYEGELNIYKVSTIVNSSLTDIPECIQPVLSFFPQ